MRAKDEYRNRDSTQVAVLDALADRHEDGMTIFELRTRVEADIDTLERALADLKADDLIDATNSGERTLVRPDDRVITHTDESDTHDLFDELRRRLPF